MSSERSSQSSPQHKNHQVCLAMTEELLKKEKKPLEIEGGLGITITIPQICHFCKKNIHKKYGLESDSLLFHSLDGNHDNWAPSNKVPSHRGCHNSFHSSGEKCNWFGEDHSGKNNPRFGKHHTEESKERNRLAHLGEKNQRFGKHHTEETKKRMRASQKKFWTNLTPEQKAEHGRKVWGGRRKAKRMRCAAL